MTAEKNKGKKVSKSVPKSKTSAKAGKVPFSKSVSNAAQKAENAPSSVSKKPVEPAQDLSPKKAASVNGSPKKESGSKSSGRFGFWAGVAILVAASSSWMWWLPSIVPGSAQWLSGRENVQASIEQTPAMESALEIQNSSPWLENQEEDVSQESSQPQSVSPEVISRTQPAIESSSPVEAVEPQPYERTTAPQSAALEETTSSSEARSLMERGAGPALPVGKSTVPASVLKSYMVLRHQIDQGKPFAKALKSFARHARLPKHLFSDLHQEVAFLGVSKMHHLINALEALIAEPPVFKRQEDRSPKTMKENVRKVFSSLFKMRRTNRKIPLLPERDDIKRRLIQLRPQLFQENWEALKRAIEGLEADVENPETLQIFAAHVQATQAGQEIIEIVDDFLLRKLGRKKLISSQRYSKIGANS